MDKRQHRPADRLGQRGPSSDDLGKVGVKCAGFCATLLVLIVGCTTTLRGFSATIPLGNGGFETVAPIADLPLTAYSTWTGNPDLMVTAENGVVPVEGSRMLKFTGQVATTNIWHVDQIERLIAPEHVTLS